MRPASMKDSSSFPEVSTDVPSHFDAMESNVDYRATYKPAYSGSDEHTLYIDLESKIISASSNRDYEALYQILYPMLEANDVSQLDAICALHWACFCGKPELVDRLINAGCDPHYPDDINLETPIYFAIRGSNVEILQMLIHRFGTELLCHENRRRLTPFLSAASEFMEENVISTLHMLEFLYLSGVSLEEQDGGGRTALMLASRRGCQFVVQWLLSRGANMSHRDHMGNSVLHHACVGSNEDTLKFLCKHGAIGLIGSRSIGAVPYEETPFGICVMRRRFLQYTMLLLWSLEYKLTGKVISFRSSYPLYYWFLAFVNLLLYYRVHKAMDYATPTQTAIADLWVLGWVFSQCFWFITYISDPGKARKNQVLSQMYRTSDSFEKDMMKDGPILGGTYEGYMQSLQKQLELINFEVYRINKDSVKRSPWLPSDGFERELSEPLDPFGSAMEDALAQRMQVCKEETQMLQTQLHGLYPRVGLERRQHCVFGYADAIMGTARELGIGTVCITCNMIRAPRSHHCGSCGVCMIRQDHHCAWVDNCIAKGNQRSFCIFIGTISLGICHLFYVFYLHFARAIALRQFNLFWDACILIFGIVGNGAWLAFVGYLTLRITRNMITDVTFYEYLRKPEYIRQQFKGKVQGRWWDFAGLSLLTSLKNCASFWLQG